MLSLALIMVIPLTHDAQLVANAVAVTNKNVPDDIKNIFTDYTLTALNEDYDTLDELNALKERLGASVNYYKDYFTRAEDIIYGNVRFDGMREFSTKQDAVNRIDQYGDLEYLQTSTLKWNFAGNVTQVIGIYGISNEQFTVYVDATDGANIPSLVVAQSQGFWNSYWRDTVRLNKGINTFIFPFGSNSNGEHSGVVYILNPYTEQTQRGNVSIYIEGGGFYPVYQKGDDEQVFVEQVKEYYEYRQTHGNVPDIAELLPDYALLTVPASTVYNAYVKNKISPAKNLEFWSDYFTRTFEFNGMTANPSNEIEQKVEPHVRLNIRRMTAYSAGAAYTYTYHIGIYGGEDKWLADYTNGSLTDYQRFACIGHEIGHVLDTKGRTLNETTNNVNAANAYFRILGNSTNNKWLPFNRAQPHVFSDYAVDYQAYDDGYIIYGNAANYDHNYLIWWCLESVFPGYWGALNNCYRYDNSTAGLTYNEKMVYYSSIVTGVDLSEYFERWGFYPDNNSKSNKFKANSTTLAFSNLMEKARNSEQIKTTYAKYWYADAKQMDFALTHFDVKPKDQVYVGETPYILSLKISGTQHTLEIGGSTDKNLLGYEIYSKDGDDEYKIAGFTYTRQFIDEHIYKNEPTYQVRAVNRYFELSKFSDTVKGPTETPNDYVCSVNDQPYTDLTTAFNTVSKTGGTINLLASCEISSPFYLSGTVTFQVDSGVTSDIIITNKSAYFFVNLLSPNATIVFKGKADAKIILDGGYANHVFAAFYAQSGSIEAEHVVVRNYNSTASLNGLLLNADNAIANFTNCRFENFSSSYSALGLVAGGTSTTFKNCVFEGITAVNPSKYSGAIGLKNGNGAIVLDNCQFINNDVADIYLNGDFTFKTHVPQAVVRLADAANTIRLDNCTEATKEISNITLYNAGYKIELSSDKISFVEIQFNLIFNWDVSQTKTHVLKGTHEFVFGDEKITLDDNNRYIVKYVDDNEKEYHIGDSITVEKNMTFTVVIDNYVTLTLKFNNDSVLPEKTVKLKKNVAFYLPRFDDSNKEIVQWTDGSAIYWAGQKYYSEKDDTLYAIYPSLFNYVFVCHEQVVDRGYAAYNTRIPLDAPRDDADNFVCWRVGAKLIDSNSEYFITSDVVFIAVYSNEGETYYDLSKSEIALSVYNYTYDGNSKTPTVTVKIGNQTVPTDNYKVVYSNNINAGVATITIVSQGFNAFGENSISFNISPVTYSSSEFVIENVTSPIQYTGNQITQTPVIKWHGSALIADKDYTLAYSGNRVNVGTVTVTITFKGNFSGQTTLTYEIIKANRNSFKVQINGWTYGQTGNSPSVSNYGEWGTVTYTYSTSQYGTYVSDKPKNAGSYWVKAEIIATNNYNEATAYAQFTIAQATLTNLPTDFTVDSRKTTLKEVSDKLPQGWHWVNETTSLVLGENRAEAVYQDTANYTNPRVVVNVTVTQYTVSIEQAQVTVVESCTYNGQAQKPAVQVELNGETLKENSDYTLVYSNNINAGTGTVTVTGAGIFVGSKVVNFTIVKQDVSDNIELVLADAELEDGVYKIIYDGKAHKISVVVRGFDGLSVDVDRTSIRSAGTYTIKAVVSADNYRGEKEFTVQVYKQTVKPQQPTEPETPDGDTLKVDAVPIAIGVGAGAVSVIGLIIYFIVRRRRIL